MPTILIRNGRVLDPARHLDAVRDLWIVDGQFAADGYRGATADETFDATGMMVMPGLVDVHVHLREPGGEAAETIESGGQAALAGGFTSIICMPNTTPPLDTPEMIRQVLDKASALRGPRVYAMGAITMGRRGQVLAPLSEMVAAGAVGFTDDGSGIPSADLMREALEACAALGVRLAEHCEDSALAKGGAMHDGDAARAAGLPGIPSESEALMVERNLELSEELHAPLHLQHISSARSVALIREARSRGAPVSAEATPHHLAFIDADAAAGGPDFKMNPPLRTERDRRELWKGVADGVLDIIATDHAPHTAEAKGRGFVAAPFGVIGLETALPAVWTHLVLQGILNPLQMVARMCLAPARAFDLRAGHIQPGQPADVTVFDPSTERAVDTQSFRSRSRNTPFAGRTLRGRVALTLVDGEVRYRDPVH